MIRSRTRAAWHLPATPSGTDPTIPTGARRFSADWPDKAPRGRATRRCRAKARRSRHRRSSNRAPRSGPPSIPAGAAEADPAPTCNRHDLHPQLTPRSLPVIIADHGPAGGEAAAKTPGDLKHDRLRRAAPAESGRERARRRLAPKWKRKSERILDRRQRKRPVRQAPSASARTVTSRPRIGSRARPPPCPRRTFPQRRRDPAPTQILRRTSARRSRRPQIRRRIPLPRRGRVRRISARRIARVRIGAASSRRASRPAQNAGLRRPSTCAILAGLRQPIHRRDRDQEDRRQAQRNDREPPAVIPSVPALSSRYRFRGWYGPGSSARLRASSDALWPGTSAAAAAATSAAASWRCR